MKFGKRLAAEAARCWPEACLDYKAIKRALKHDLACKGEQQCAGRGGSSIPVGIFLSIWVGRHQASL